MRPVQKALVYAVWMTGTREISSPSTCLVLILRGKGGNFLNYSGLLLQRELRKHWQGDDLGRNSPRYRKVPQTIVHESVGLLQMKRYGIVNTCTDPCFFQVVHHAVAILGPE